jgi:hypothetical protein
MSKDRNAFINTDSLDGIEHYSWDLLVKGALKSKEPFHFPVLGSMGKESVELRTVVLRQANRDKKSLIFHTDIRSPKIEQIRRNPLVSFLFYDNRKLVQLRIKAEASIHHQDEVARQQWDRCQLSSRKAYMGDIPGQISTSNSHGLPEHLVGQIPSQAESEKGYPNFAAVICQINFLEWLWLNREGHRRAEFHYDNNQQWTANWLMP